MKECVRAMKSARATTHQHRWPLRGIAPRPTRASRWLARAEWIAAALVLGVVLVPLGTLARLALAAAVLVLLGVACAFRARAGRVAESGWIAVDELGLSRERPGKALTRLAEWGSRFGVVVLASEKRDHGVLAITTLAATRYVPVRADGPDDAEPARTLFSRGSALSDADLRLAVDEDGALSAADAAALLSAVRARDPLAEGRIVLSDPHGALVVLEGDVLRAGERVIDLASPLEWRAFLFVEAGGPGAASVVQATWVRQAGVEVVLVADAAREASHPRGTRVSHPDAPPPLELRMAIERLFMAPLRSALDRAPRASRAPAPRAPPVAPASPT